MRRTVAILAVGTLLATLALAHAASAIHVRPKGATPLRDSLVIAQRACVPGGATTHAPPLAFPSCNPPGQTSNFLTAGTPDANGAGVNLVGYVRLIRLAADISIDTSTSDVRCLPATAAAVCSNANVADGPDYNGQLQLEIGLRITDHNNSPPAGSPGTVIDILYPVKVTCANTASNTIGGTCAVATSMNALVPGSASPGFLAVYQIPQRTSQGGIQVYDGGANGVAGSTGATLFLEPGVFLP